MNAADPTQTDGHEHPSVAELRKLVGEVPDPELPLLTLEDLGILRDLSIEQDTVVVTLTPTYSGCPAVEYIESGVRELLVSAGWEQIEIRRSLAPAWTTDWITPKGREKLYEAGIAPPASASAGTQVQIGSRRAPTVQCPRCGSDDTTEISVFGSTACKALYRCGSCAEPFDYFKEI